MRAVVQRVSSASVSVDGEVVGSIGGGLLVLLGVGRGDTAAEAAWIAGKIARLRIFADAEGLMNFSVRDVDGEVLLVSQFTLLGDTRKGHRPSFVEAADPADAEALYEETARALRDEGVPVATGSFGAMMEVALVNDGPVTIIMESR